MSKSKVLSSSSLPRILDSSAGLGKQCAVTCACDGDACHCGPDCQCSRTVDATPASREASALRFGAPVVLGVLAVALLSGLALTGCMSPPRTLDLSLDKPTDAKAFVVAIHPRSETIAINQLHAWEVKVAAPDGSPVLHAHIDVDGGMPQHGHGFPTRPRITEELGDGRYLLEGMKFSMTGWWVIKLDIASQGAHDAVTFNKVIELPSRDRV